LDTSSETNDSSFPDEASKGESSSVTNDSTFSSEGSQGALSGTTSDLTLPSEESQGKLSGPTNDSSFPGEAPKGNPRSIMKEHNLPSDPTNGQDYPNERSRGTRQIKFPNNRAEVHQLAAEKKVIVTWDCITRGPNDRIQWRCTCRLRYNGAEVSYDGDWELTKGEAKESAAIEALAALRFL
jgi:hypothetical protein